jgi:hypothetical protein
MYLFGRFNLQPSTELPCEFRRATGQDINRVRDEGFEVDDDNDSFLTALALEASY